MKRLFQCIFLCHLLGFCHILVFANDTSLKWLYQSTEHFEIYYQEKYQSIGEYVSQIAEDLLAQQTERYPLVNNQKIQLTLHHDLFSNGFANPFQNRLGLWISKWPNPLRGEHQWLQNVLAHELAHLLTIRQAKPISPSIIGLVVGYQDFFNERNHLKTQLILPTSFMPHWFSEGIAQYESAKLGFDSWDSKRDMLLRTATLHDSLLTYQQMGVFNGKPLNFELGPYTQGFAFVRYLAKEYGDKWIQSLWKERKKWYSFSLSSVFKKTIGKTTKELWNQWTKETQKHYLSQKSKIGMQITGTKISSQRFYNMFPQWGSQGKNIYFISHKPKTFQRSLFSLSVDSLPSSNDSSHLMPQFVSSAITREFTLRKQKIITSIQDKSLILKIGDLHFDSTSSSASLKPLKKISDFHNSFHADFHPNANQIIFVREYLTQFLLYQATLDSSGVIDSLTIEKIYPFQENAIPIGFRISNPRYSPNGKQVLFSFFDGASQKIALLDLTTKTIRLLLSQAKAEFLNPEWIDNQSFIFSSDFQNNIFNLFVYHAKTKKIFPLTNTLGGAFQPRFHPKAKKIVYIGYDIDGFSLYLLDLLPTFSSSQFFQSHGIDSVVSHMPQTIFSTTTDIDTLFFESVQQSRAFYSQNSYSSIQSIGHPYLQPFALIQERTSVNKTATQGDPKVFLGANIFWNDPLNWQRISLSFLLEVNPQFEYFNLSGGVPFTRVDYDLLLNYQNQTLPVIFDFNILLQNLNSFDTIIDNSQGLNQSEISKNSQLFTEVRVDFRYPFQKNKIFQTTFNHFIGLGISYRRINFNFFDVPFRFNVSNQFTSEFFWNLNTLKSTSNPINPLGWFISTRYSWSFSQLIRGSDSFRDNFRVDENGLQQENFQNFVLQNWNSLTRYSFKLPWFSNHSLKVSQEFKSILSWKITNEISPERLNPFFLHPLDIRGLPLLADTENFFQQGSHSIRFATDYYFPIWKNLNRGFIEPLFFKDIFLNGFTEAGVVWNKNIWNVNTNLKDWTYAAGFGIQTSTLFYHQFPLLFFVEVARVLNQNQFGLRNLRVLNLNTFATEIRWGVSLGFSNPFTLGK